MRQACWLLGAFSAPALALVSIPFSRMTPSQILAARGLDARASIQESLLNNISLYQASLTIGTPPQQFSLQIDTGSSDVFILASTADQCTTASIQAQNNGGCFGGTYDHTKSSTYDDIAPGQFEVSYGDQTGAYGDFITDDLTIGGATVKSQIMGLAYRVTTGSGLLGIGYDTNEASYVVGNISRPYSSIIDTMYNQSLINTKAYSLYLDDQTAGTGSIIFGGADTNKFIGTLKTVNVLSEKGVYREFLVSMTAISLTNQSGTVTQIGSGSIPVLLDSGTTLTYLPDNIYASIGRDIFGGTLDSNSGAYIIDCAFRTTQTMGYFSFTFGSSGPVINVPVGEMVRQSGSGSSARCSLGMRAAGSSTYILGDTFLRSAYVVYDLTHNQISMAQTNFESNTTNLVEFSRTQTAVPSLTGVATGNTIEPTSTKAAAGAGPAPWERSALIVFALTSALTLLGGSFFLL